MGAPFVQPFVFMGSGGPRNWFGDGSLGDVRITDAGGAEASQDSGQTWTAITGWTREGNVVLVPSVEDGDMVVLHCRSLHIEAGMTLTTSQRCRGLLVYTQRDAVINGTLTMTARGCHANPADAAVTADTPVAPGDGHAVPESGITIRRLARGLTDTDLATDLMHGCGLDAVTSEANQPVVDGRGIVVRIPRVGGAGGAGVSSGGDAGGQGNVGGTSLGGTGGGGSGAHSSSSQYSGDGGDGTCWSGGSGSGGGHDVSTADADNYGGPGGDAAGGYTPGGGAGNPAGAGGVTPANDGTGGLLMLVVGGAIAGAGTLSADGVRGGIGGYSSGGSSGGGVVLTMFARDNAYTGSITANGGEAAIATANSKPGGAGGAGAVVGPVKIDPR
jgi:hypothetical protein